MGEDKPGWYHAGTGRLRYMDAHAWTEQYKPIEGLQTAPTPSGALTGDGSAERRAQLAVDETSVVVCLSTEGPITTVE